MQVDDRLCLERKQGFKIPSGNNFSHSGVPIHLSLTGRQMEQWNVLMVCVCPGLQELCDGLRQQTAGLKVLVLRSNHITAHGMLHLAQALVRNANMRSKEHWPAVNPIRTSTFRCCLTLKSRFKVSENLLFRALS